MALLQNEVPYRLYAVKIARIPNLAGSPPPWQCAAMSTLATTDPKELRPLLRERIEHATDAELFAMRNLLLDLEIGRLRESLGEAADEALAKLKPGEIEDSTRAHRAQHPYR